MDSRVSLQPAYVLHRRPFQNSSLLIELFTYDYGRVKAIAKGARREKSRYRAYLQLFQPLLVSLSGRGEVKTLTAAESSMSAITLQGERLFSGLYINELLTRLLHNAEEHTVLYRHYQQTLLALSGGDSLHTCLRRFEMQLLEELGYGLNLEEDRLSHRPIVADQDYLFTPDVGFEQLIAPPPARERVFAGQHLLSLRKLDLTDAGAAAAAKRLLRLALAVHLGDKPLASRSLFAARST